ncbi:hypothetical protein D3C76_741490 [compost metagenome]
MFAPLFGVVLVDHFLIRRRMTVANIPALRWGSLLAWAGGVATYHALANYLPDVGATLPALLVAGVLQALLGRGEALALDAGKTGA